MRSEPGGSWLDRREPRPPAELRSLLEGDLVARPSPEELVEAGLGRLRTAREAAGERTAAFHLLAADAYLTYACEMVVAPAGGAEASPGGGADPEERLAGLLRRVAGPES